MARRQRWALLTLLLQVDAGLQDIARTGKLAELAWLMHAGVPDTVGLGSRPEEGAWAARGGGRGAILVVAPISISRLCGSVVP
jgi:hypothetical protein